MAYSQVLNYIWTHPTNRRRKLRALCESVSWQVKKRLTGRPADMHVFGSMKLRCYPDSRGASMMVYTGGWYDYDDMHFVARYLRPGDSVIDVGANIGVYALLMASLVGDTGRVVAFEPGRQSFERLQENVRLNGLSNVELSRAAVGETRGIVRFHQTQDVTNRIAVAGESAGIEEVPCIALDEELAGQRFALGKIDIEGAEMMAFRGSRRMLADANPSVWLLELKDRLLKPFGTSSQEVAELLDDAGYDLATYEADDRKLSLITDPRYYDGNALAIHRSAADLVRRRLSSEA